MVYFPAQTPESQLLGDGSDAAQSPGSEWVRRMWGGGSLSFHPTRKIQLMDHGVLKEKVTDIQSRGIEGSNGERLFVWFERRMWSAREQMVAETLQDDAAALVERRCLVFFKEPKDTKVPTRVVKGIPHFFLSSSSTLRPKLLKPQCSAAPV